MLHTANAPSKPTTPPTTNPTRRATTARLFSFNTYLPDTLIHYAPKCVEGEFCEVELPLYGVLGSPHSPRPNGPGRSLSVGRAGFVSTLSQGRRVLPRLRTGGAYVH